MVATLRQVRFFFEQQIQDSPTTVTPSPHTQKDPHDPAVACLDPAFLARLEGGMGLEGSAKGCFGGSGETPLGVYLNREITGFSMVFLLFSFQEILGRSPYFDSNVAQPTCQKRTCSATERHGKLHLEFVGK